MTFHAITDWKTIRTLASDNWRSGLTVALISVPLSIALSIASGAGPLPGLITGIWATLLASFFGGSNYNIIGAAGALTTTLFAATLVAPFGMAALVLPLLALLVGIMIFVIWLLNADRFLYYIPSSVMYGFAGGVAFLIAASQLFDATGLSSLKRTGTFLGDIGLFWAHKAEVDHGTIGVFLIFIALIILIKRFIPKIPAVIPISILGIIFGFVESRFISSIDVMTLGDKFGSFSGALYAPGPWPYITQMLATPSAIIPLIKISGVVALIAVLETLITAKIGDKITRTQSSARQELFGLALANIGSGVMGGLPATGVFIRTGANIKAGATHRMSGTIAGLATAVIALLVLPFFSYIPMAVIAAILMNTAIGLIEVHQFKEFWIHERLSFFVALIVVFVTVFEDAGVGVLIGSFIALLLFADRISHGRFDLIVNYTNGHKEEYRGERTLHLPHDKQIEVVTYSIAGFLGYIDNAQHAANLRHLSRLHNVHAVIIRLRDLFSIDIEGTQMLEEAIAELRRHKKPVYLSSANAVMITHLKKMDGIRALIDDGFLYPKTSLALEHFRQKTR
jgi:SulP family sulfate permease